jgi:translocation protein SEC63
MKQIKSKYRTLSLLWHPDKARPDAAKNETIESINARWVEITKAHQALTDEEVRNNFIQYGHPDGKQSFSIGIALPKFIISDGNGKYVVLVYTLLLGVLLPYMVGSWWYGTQRRSKEGVLMESANNMFREYDDGLDEDGIITVLSSGREFKDLLKGDKAESGLPKIESRIAASLSAKSREKLEEIDSPVRRKALALLWAYLHRVELDDESLNRAKFEVGPIARDLTLSFTTISLAFSNTAPIIASYNTGQHLVQAMAPKSSPLLQLPHFNPSVVSAIEGDSKVHMSVQQFMDLPDEQRRHLAVGPRLLTDRQYKSAVEVARQLPHFRVAKAFFKVTGEKFIIPSSLVSLVVKGRFIPPGSQNIPEINETDLEDVDPAEDDLDALAGRKKTTVKGPDGKPIPVDDTPVLPALTFSPRFAHDHSPKFFIFLTDSKQGKMAVPPFSFTDFDRPIFDDDRKPTFNMQTMKCQFAAPPHPGHYTFAMHLVCDSYVGLDTKSEVTLHVEEASKAAEMTADDEISEPEEGKSPRVTLPPPQKSYDTQLVTNWVLTSMEQTPWLAR